MYNNNKIIGIIPARGGSKGIRKKNIVDLAGKPLIAYTIEQAKGSKYIDKIIVTTDDEEIADISRSLGAEVPFSRPKALATDEAKGIDVVLHAITWFDSNEESFDIVMMLQPTSPLRLSEDIDKAIEMLFLKNAMAIVSVCKSEHHPLWSNTLPEDSNMKNFINPEYMNKNRQELPVFYRLNGAIYLSFCNYIKDRKSFYGENTFAYIMPDERSIDIDNMLDFKLAELLLNSVTV